MLPYPCLVVLEICNDPLTILAPFSTPTVHQKLHNDCRSRYTQLGIALLVVLLLLTLIVVPVVVSKNSGKRDKGQEKIVEGGGA